MSDSAPAYGLWPLVVVNALIFIVFAFSFTKPKTQRDWRTFGAFSAFIVALFAEMYGFPLTVYFFSGWLATRLPGVDLFSHDAGHLLENLIGPGGDPHLGPFHLVSNVLIFAGLILLSRAWQVLYQAQREHSLAISGPYARIRHPQYAAFVLIMFGFLLQWPTLPTLLMFPVLVWMYSRLARTEERAAEKEFGEAWRVYASRTPGFVPFRQKQ
ncbi:MAG: isoprenylcysteine carboxylmethyltransferase family protein [Actinomycetota bacterium]|nr:isoprenylcysteine carboxylmethyltransferase family protein [Actinomycetota bacterium]